MGSSKKLSYQRVFVQGNLYEDYVKPPSGRLKTGKTYPHSSDRQRRHGKDEEDLGGGEQGHA